MATPRVKSRAGSTVARLAPTTASEFDRVSCPSRGESRGQHVLVAHPVQQLLGAPGAGGEYHLTRPDRPAPHWPDMQLAGTHGVDQPGSVRLRAHRSHRGHRVHPAPARSAK